MKVFLLSTLGGYLSTDRPNPFAKPWVRDWEQFEIIPIKIVDETNYEVAIKTRDGDFLSATPSLPQNSHGYQLLEFRRGEPPDGTPGDWEIFTASIDGINRVTFRTHCGTYINTQGHECRWGKGWISHRLVGTEQLVQQCKFVITKPEWFAQFGQQGCLNGKQEVYRTISLPVTACLRLLSKFFLPGPISEIFGGEIFGGEIFGGAEGSEAGAGAQADGAGAPADGAGAQADGAGAPADGAGAQADGAGAQADESAAGWQKAAERYIQRGIIAGGICILSSLAKGRAYDYNAAQHSNLVIFAGSDLRQLLETGSAPI